MKMIQLLLFVTLGVNVLACSSSVSHEGRGDQPRANLFEPIGDARDLKPAQQKILERLKRQPSLSVVNLVKVNTNNFTRDEFELNLIPNKTFRSKKTKIETRDQNDYTWLGIVDSREDAIFVVNGQNVTGTIKAEGKTFQLRPLGDGVHALLRLDESKLPPDHPPSFKELERKRPAPRDLDKARRDARARGDVLPTIDLLVAYTKEVKDNTPDIGSFIQLAIDETNKSYSNSKVNAKVRRVKSLEVDYTGSSVDPALASLQGRSDGIMDEVHSARDAAKADVVMLLMDHSDYCGLAADILAVAGSAFAVVDYTCATGYYSFGHELGHLLGVRHNPEEDPATEPFPYGHGYCNAGKFRTIMSYDCSPSCPRVPYWSNPDVKLDGEPTGTVDLHNDAKVLNETASIIADFSNFL